ncbi:conserved hypothetical protein [Neospora caninum Liverpool]|uniref:Eukaryotic initiation factor 4E n=1 Tax=Neospora caninum (strain Liverpool) TaxID=572307 RepID=F0VN87_NEOCL|nr:conserved hypothetical protein [Neospora caninum Liverpool]CBZ55183.1 conserved hypothetical protein [Neospora caninum Liverpool]|eukprot:XP_003885211.1 conserved hypothetical protein [Neospora caninum Liverpool]
MHGKGSRGTPSSLINRQDKEHFSGWFNGDFGFFLPCVLRRRTFMRVFGAWPPLVSLSPVGPTCTERKNRGEAILAADPSRLMAAREEQMAMRGPSPGDFEGGSFSDTCKSFSALEDVSPSHAKAEAVPEKAFLVCCPVPDAAGGGVSFLTPRPGLAGDSPSTTESAGSVWSPSTPPTMDSESPVYGPPHSLLPGDSHQMLPPTDAAETLPPAYAPRESGEIFFLSPSCGQRECTPADAATEEAAEDQTPAAARRRRWASFDVQDSDTDLFEPDDSDQDEDFDLASSARGEGSLSPFGARHGARACARFASRRAPKRPGEEHSLAVTRGRGATPEGRSSGTGAVEKGKNASGSDRRGRVRGGLEGYKEQSGMEACQSSSQRGGSSRQSDAAPCSAFANHNRFAALSNGDASGRGEPPRPAKGGVHAAEEHRPRSQGGPRGRGRHPGKGSEAGPDSARATSRSASVANKGWDVRDTPFSGPGGSAGKASRGESAERAERALGTPVGAEGFELFRNSLTLQLLQGRDQGFRFVGESGEHLDRAERKQNGDSDEGWVIAGRKRKPVAETGSRRSAGRDAEGKGKGKRDERPAVEWIAWLDPCSSAANTTNVDSAHAAQKSTDAARCGPGLEAASAAETSAGEGLEKGACSNEQREESNAQDRDRISETADGHGEPASHGGSRREAKEEKGKASGSGSGKKLEGGGGAVSWSKQLQEEYEQGLERVGKMSSWTAVSPFLAWWLPASASRGNLHNLCFFKNPVKPLWEHPDNIKGGHFALRRFATKATVQDMFLLLASTVLKDEHLGAVRHCNGIVLCIRQHWRKHKIEFWTASLENGVLSQQESLLRRLLSQLPGNAGHGIEIEFISHREVVQRNQMKLLRARGKLSKTAGGTGKPVPAGASHAASWSGVCAQKPLLPRSSVPGSAEIPAPPLLPEGPYAPGAKKKSYEKRGSGKKHGAGWEQGAGDCGGGCQNAERESALPLLGAKKSAWDASSALDGERRSCTSPRHGDGSGRERRGEHLSPRSRHVSRKKDSKEAGSQTEKKRHGAFGEGDEKVSLPAPASRSASAAGNRGCPLLPDDGGLCDSENPDSCPHGQGPSPALGDHTGRGDAPGESAAPAWSGDRRVPGGARGRGSNPKSGDLPALMQSPPPLLPSDSLAFPGRLPVWQASVGSPGALPHAGKPWEEDLSLLYSADFHEEGEEARRGSGAGLTQFGGSGQGEALCPRHPLSQCGQPAPGRLSTSPGSTTSRTPPGNPSSTSPLLRPSVGYPRQGPQPLGRRGVGAFSLGSSWPRGAPQSGSYAGKGSDACASGTSQSAGCAPSTASRCGGDSALRAALSRHVDDAPTSVPSHLSREDARSVTGPKSGKTRVGQQPGQNGLGLRRGDDDLGVFPRGSGRGASRGPWRTYCANDEEQRRRLATKMVARIDVKSIPDYFSMQLAANLGGASIGSAAALHGGVGGSGISAAGLTTAPSPLGSSFLALHASGSVSTSSTHGSEAGNDASSATGASEAAGRAPLSEARFGTVSAAHPFPLFPGVGLPGGVLPDGFSPQLLASPSVGRAVAAVLQVQQLPFSPVMQSVQQQLGLIPPKPGAPQAVGQAAGGVQGGLETGGAPLPDSSSSRRSAYEDSLQDLCLPPLLGNSASRQTSPLSSPSAVSSQDLPHVGSTTDPFRQEEVAQSAPEKGPFSKRPFAFNPLAAVFRPSWVSERSSSQRPGAPQEGGVATACADPRDESLAEGTTGASVDEEKGQVRRCRERSTPSEEPKDYVAGKHTIASVCHALPAAAQAVAPAVSADKSGRNEAMERPEDRRE